MIQSDIFILLLIILLILDDDRDRDCHKNEVGGINKLIIFFLLLFPRRGRFYDNDMDEPPPFLF